MKRIALLAVAMVLVAAAGTGVVLSGRRPDDTARAPVPKADSVWYHASDVALLAKSSRPHLVEFFHPD